MTDDIEGYQTVTRKPNFNVTLKLQILFLNQRSHMATFQKPWEHSKYLHTDMWWPIFLLPLNPPITQCAMHIRSIKIPGQYLKYLPLPMCLGVGVVGAPSGEVQGRFNPRGPRPGANWEAVSPLGAWKYAVDESGERGPERIIIITMVCKTGDTTLHVDFQIVAPRAVLKFLADAEEISSNPLSWW